MKPVVKYLLFLLTLPAFGQISLSSSATPCGSNTSCIALPQLTTAIVPTAGSDEVYTNGANLMVEIGTATPFAIGALGAPSTNIPNGTQAVTASTTTLSSTTEVLALTGSSGGAAMVASLSVSGYCTPSSTASCPMVLINTSTTAIATSDGSAANDFADTYSIKPLNGVLVCTSYGSLWYCK